MSNEFGTTRRGFLGTASAATAFTLTASQSANAAPTSAEQVAQAMPAQGVSSAPGTPDATPTWSKPAAMSIPKEGYFKLEQGRYGPVYPRTPANYGFTVIAKVKPGREAAI